MLKVPGPNAHKNQIFYKKLQEIYIIYIYNREKIFKKNFGYIHRPNILRNYYAQIFAKIKFFKKNIKNKGETDGSPFTITP